MSPAPAPRKLPSKKTGRGWVKVPTDYLPVRKDLSRMGKVCLDLILRETLGFDRASAVIQDDKFIRAAGNVEEKTIWAGLAEVCAKRLVFQKKTDFGPEYTLDLENETPSGHTCVAYCTTCRAVRKFVLAQYFGYVPYAFFEDLPSRVPKSVSTVVLLIIMASNRWDPAIRDFAPVEVDLSVDDIAEMGEMSKRQVKRAIQVAAHHQLIKTNFRKGRTTTYSFVPDHFTTGLQSLVQKRPKCRTRAAQSASPPVREKKTPIEPTTLNDKSGDILQESKTTPKAFGRCCVCLVFQAIDPLPKGISAPTIARAGPSPPEEAKTTSKSKPEVSQEIEVYWGHTFEVFFDNWVQRGREVNSLSYKFKCKRLWDELITSPAMAERVVLWTDQKFSTTGAGSDF